MDRNNLSIRIDLLTQQLIHTYSPEKIILFGSAAQNSGEVNDIDLFIVKEDVPHAGTERIRQLYRMMDTDLPVDYLVYRPAEVSERLTLGDPFIQDILLHGKVLYG